MSTVLSDYVYLQPMDGGKAKRVLVQRSHFVVPDGGKGNWFHNRLVKMPGAPFMEDAGDGLPVYLVDEPAAVLNELVACAKDPARAKRATVDVPKSIRRVLDLPTWIAILEKFGLEQLDEAPPVEPKTKKPRRDLPDWFPTAAARRETKANETSIHTLGTTKPLIAELVYLACEIDRTKGRTAVVSISDNNAGRDALALIASVGYTTTRRLDARPDPGQLDYDISW